MTHTNSGHCQHTLSNNKYRHNTQSHIQTDTHLSQTYMSQYHLTHTHKYETAISAHDAYTVSKNTSNGQRSTAPTLKKRAQCNNPQPHIRTTLNTTASNKKKKKKKDHHTHIAYFKQYTSKTKKKDSVTSFCGAWRAACMQTQVTKICSESLWQPKKWP